MRTSLLSWAIALALLCLPAGAAATERTSAYDLIEATAPHFGRHLDSATRAVLRLISLEEARALARGELLLGDLALPDGTPLSHFLASALGADPFEVPFYSLDAGGGSAAASEFKVIGTIGQPDAALLDSESGAFAVYGGLRRPLQGVFTLFADGFETESTQRWSASQP